MRRHGAARAVRIGSAGEQLFHRRRFGDGPVPQEKLGAGVLGNRPGEIVALRLVAAFGEREAVLARLLDAFRQHPLADGLGEPDDRSHDRTIARSHDRTIAASASSRPSSRTNDLSILILWTGSRLR
jgi:hypothetical protein